MGGRYKDVDDALAALEALNERIGRVIGNLLAYSNLLEKTKSLPRAEDDILEQLLVELGLPFIKVLFRGQMPPEDFYLPKATSTTSRQELVKALRADVSYFLEDSHSIGDKAYWRIMAEWVEGMAHLEERLVESR